MTEFVFGNEGAGAISRRRALKLGAAATGATLLIPGFFGQVGWAYADDKPPLGTWPAGSQGGSVTIGATVPRTGAYAVQGEDELKGMQLAVEHLNEGHDLIRQIAPKVTKGVLGKQVNLVVADSAAKPNNAVQEQQVFINENKIIADDRRDLVGGRGGAEQIRSAGEDPLRDRESRARTTRLARIARAIRSASVSMARPRPTRSARCS